MDKKDFPLSFFLFSLPAAHTWLKTADPRAPPHVHPRSWGGAIGFRACRDAAALEGVVTQLEFFLPKTSPAEPRARALASRAQAPLAVAGKAPRAAASEAGAAPRPVQRARASRAIAAACKVFLTSKGSSQEGAPSAVAERPKEAGPCPKHGSQEAAPSAVAVTPP